MGVLYPNNVPPSQEIDRYVDGIDRYVGGIDMYVGGINFLLQRKRAGFSLFMKVNLFSSNTNTNSTIRVGRHLQKGNGLQVVRSCWPTEPCVLAGQIEIVL